MPLSAHDWPSTSCSTLEMYFEAILIRAVDGKYGNHTSTRTRTRIETPHCGPQQAGYLPAVNLSLSRPWSLRTRSCTVAWGERCSHGRHGCHCTHVRVTRRGAQTYSPTPIDWLESLPPCMPPWRHSRQTEVYTPEYKATVLQYAMQDTIHPTNSQP